MADDAIIQIVLGHLNVYLQFVFLFLIIDKIDDVVGLIRKQSPLTIPIMGFPYQAAYRSVPFDGFYPVFLFVELSSHVPETDAESVFLGDVQKVRRTRISPDVFKFRIFIDRDPVRPVRRAMGQERDLFFLGEFVHLLEIVEYFVSLDHSAFFIFVLEIIAVLVTIAGFVRPRIESECRVQLDADVTSFFKAKL